MLDCDAVHQVQMIERNNLLASISGFRRQSKHKVDSPVDTIVKVMRSLYLVYMEPLVNPIVRQVESTNQVPARSKNIPTVVGNAGPHRPQFLPWMSHVAFCSCCFSVGILGHQYPG